MHPLADRLLGASPQRPLVAGGSQRLAGRRPIAGRRRAANSSAVDGHQNGKPREALRGIVILPGLGNSSSDYDDFKQDLTDLGMDVKVPMVRRVDWLRNAAGLVDSNYWKGTLKPRPTVDWYLKRLDEAVDTVKREVNGAPVTLLAHSAGGWLARVYLKDFGTTGIDSLITLGSPHSPPPEGAKNVVDQTRGILTSCSQDCPGAFHPEIKYVTVAGRYIKGARFGDEASFREKLVGLGYQQVCGDPGVWGDGVVPMVSAHLEGATTVDLDEVYHSPVGAQRSAEDRENGSRVWYGSRGVLEQWVGHLWGDGDAGSHKVGGTGGSKNEGRSDEESSSG